MPKPNQVHEAPKSRCLWLDELSTVEAEEAAKDGSVVIFPVGSVEEHGDHLPLCTDSIQPEYIALEVAKKTGCIVAPPFRYGICNATRNFPGTLTIEFDTLYKIAHDVLSELVRNGFCRIYCVKRSCRKLAYGCVEACSPRHVVKNDESQGVGKVRIMVLSDFDFAEELTPKYASENDGHAGMLETSRVMAIKPELLKLKESRYLAMPRFEVVSHPELYFPSGVNGDPTAASQEKGQKINEYIIKQVEKLVKEIKTKKMFG